MRRFNYRARDSKTGKSVKGAIQAENEMAAGKLLLGQGYVPDSIVEEDASGVIGKIRSRVSAKDRIVFTRQFATSPAGGSVGNSL